MIKIKFAELGKVIVIINIIIAIMAFSGHAYEKNSKKQTNTVTVIDDIGRKVVVNLPLKTFVYHGHNCYLYETLRALNPELEVIGATNRFVRSGGYRYSSVYFPEFLNVTNIGLLKSPDYEIIAKLKPDIIFSDGACFTFDWKKTPYIPVIIMDVEPTVNLSILKQKVMKLALLLNREEEAKKYIEWYTKWFTKLKKRIMGVPKNKRPLVFLSYYDAVRYGDKRFSVAARNNRNTVIIHMAGGRSLGDEINGSGSIKIDAEWIINRNPDVIILTNNHWVDYDVKNPLKAQKMIDHFMRRSEFTHVRAVKDRRVYMMNTGHLVLGGASGLIGALYIAKWLYPKRLADFDPQAVHEEFVSKFQHLDIDLNAVWCVYPKP